MSDDDDLTEVGEAVAAKGRKRQGRGLDALAMRDLRSARKLFKAGDVSAEEANFLVASASVLATLDLAAAIREAQRAPVDD